MGENEIVCNTDWWSNGIAIADILITSFFGIWIASSLQRNVTKARYIREYFISELMEIRDDYSVFFKELYNSELAAQTISSRLKVISCRINNLDEYIHQYYNIEKTLLKDAHFKFQTYITGTNEFNDQYSCDRVKFEANTILLVTKEQAEIVKAMTQRVLDINSAKTRKKNWFRH